jgi:hypothetical protein
MPCCHSDKINIHQQMAHPQLLQCSWHAVVTIHLAPKLHTIHLLTNMKSIFDVTIAMLDFLLHSFHTIAA